MFLLLPSIPSSFSADMCKSRTNICKHAAFRPAQLHFLRKTLTKTLKLAVSVIEPCSGRKLQAEAKSMKMSKMWEILNGFKRFCKTHGWKTSEGEDWIELNEDYHNFLWTRNVTPSSFKAIISNRKCIVQKGSSYTVVEPSHLAWLFSEIPSKDLETMVLENPDFSKRIAIYDLSPLLEGKNLCIKLNNTDSPVFHEFEAFLQNELKVKVRPLQPSSSSNVKASDNLLPEFA